MNGLRYRVVISTQRVLDSAVVERTFDNITVSTGATPSSAAPPFRLHSCTAMSQETRMENTAVTPMTGAPNYARVKSNIVIPMNMDFTDENGAEMRTITTFTYPEDIVLYVPNGANNTASFPYEITAEGVAQTTEGVGDRATTTIEKLCVRIITRVTAQTDMLIPAYGFAPVNPAVTYTNETCRDFFAQPLFPNGKAAAVCRQGN
jgi:hypothetical protein